MCQAIVDIEWQAQQWLNRANAQPNVSPLLTGLKAYAYKLAHIQTEFSASYAKKWVPVIKQYDMDHSFASKYDTSGLHGAKGKPKAVSQPHIDTGLESE